MIACLVFDHNDGRHLASDACQKRSLCVHARCSRADDEALLPLRRASATIQDRASVIAGANPVTGLSHQAKRLIFYQMPAAWKITANKRPQEIGEPSTREFYLVALPEREAAVAVLRMREGYNDAELEVNGQVSAESLDWLDIKPGEIFCIWAIR